MLEKVDLEKSVDKESYKRVSDELSARLGVLQRKCKAEKIPVIIVFEGLDAAGKGVQINRLIKRARRRGCARFCGVTGSRRRKTGGLPFLTKAGTAA